MASLSAAEVYDLYLVDNFRAANGGLQPLAIDPAFLAEAEQHTNEQIANNTFFHTADLVSDISAAGFVWYNGYYGFFENHAWNGGYGYSEQQYIDLMQYNLEQSASHRANLLNPNHEIAGIGAEFGSSVDGSGPSYNGYNDYAYITQDLGYNERAPFITGFVYTDIDADGRLDIGEGQNGTTVTVRNAATGQVLSTTTDDGYYGIQLAPNSDWYVQVGDEPAQLIHLADQNVRFDDIDAVVVQPPASQTYTISKQSPAPIITDYDPGDKFDFSAIDANVKQAGNQAFTWAPTTTHTAKGELWITHTDFDNDGDLDTAFMANDHSNRQYVAAYVQDDLINPGSLTPGFDLYL